MSKAPAKSNGEGKAAEKAPMEELVVTPENVQEMLRMAFNDAQRESDVDAVADILAGAIAKNMGFGTGMWRAPAHMVRCSADSTCTRYLCIGMNRLLSSRSQAHRRLARAANRRAQCPQLQAPAEPVWHHSLRQLPSCACSYSRSSSPELVRPCRHTGRGRDRNFPAAPN